MSKLEDFKSNLNLTMVLPRISLFMQYLHQRITPNKVLQFSKTEPCLLLELIIWFLWSLLAALHPTVGSTMVT